MKNRGWIGLLCLVIVLGAAWMSTSGSGEKTGAGWKEVAPGIWRYAGWPAGHALVDGDAALLIDAPNEHVDLKGIRKFDGVLLTHYHRDICRGVNSLLKKGIRVRAPKGSEEWLSTKGVASYWKNSLPLRNSRTAYLVVPEGFEGIDYSLAAGQKFSWRGWDLQVIATPGHARVHAAIAARKGKDGPLAIFCGGALAAPGKMWSPYTTDWDHWTDLGLKPAAESLRALAKLKPAALYPAYGPPITANTVDVLTRTAEVIDEVGFLKSFERFSKQRLKNPPAYAFLAKEQAGSAGQLPWSKISEHLYLTGNTYVLVSKENAIMVFDPWGKRSVEQVRKLQKDKKLGPIELVMFSHAHFDHYDGVYDLPGRNKFQVWSLDEVAGPLADPWFYRAPFLDPRPIKFDRRLKDGGTATWREYTFRFHHFPGQTYFTMAVETKIDGKKCLFTADNFFHIDLYSGTGGWMGLNRSWPGYYAASAKKVLELRPEWVLAEHGGAFEFNAEDIRRRIRWGEAAAKACDALSPSGNHRHDWDPHRLHIEPLVHKAKPGATLKATLVAGNPLEKSEKLEAVLEGRGWFPDQKFQMEIAPAKTVRRDFNLRLDAKMPSGRLIFVLRSIQGTIPNGADAFLAVDVNE